MASKPENVLDMQVSLQHKIGNKTLGAHLEALDPKDIFNPNAGFFYSYKATVNFRDALIGQPPHFLDGLINNEDFRVWLLKARNFLYTLFLDPSIFDPEFQKGIQPLIDLFYYFNKADPAIPLYLCGFEVIKAIPHLKKKNCKDKEPSKSNLEKFERSYGRSFNETIQTYVFADPANPIAPANCEEIISGAFETYTSAILKRSPPKSNKKKATISSVRPQEPISSVIPKQPATSPLEQACYVAWLLSRIKKDPRFSGVEGERYKRLEEGRHKELNTYLDFLEAQYFSRQPSGQDLYYRKSNSGNLKAHPAVKALFISTEELVYSRIERINTWNDAESQQMGLKALFLKLFNPVNTVSFFPSFNFSFKIVNTIKETKDLYIEWRNVLGLLSDEIEASPLAPSDKDDLFHRRDSFEALAILEISELDTNIENIENMENQSGPSIKPCAL